MKQSKKLLQNIRSTREAKKIYPRIYGGENGLVSNRLREN